MALSIRFDIDPATRKKLDRLNPRVVDQAFMKGGGSFQIYALRLLPKLTQQKVRRGTGDLARKWRTEQPSPNEIRIKNVAISKGPSRTPYATFVEFGTRPHGIVPRFKKVLRWRTGGRGPVSAFKAGKALQKGNFIFSMKVQHPGTRARKIFGAFWPGGAKKLGQFISEALTNALSAR